MNTPSKMSAPGTPRLWPGRLGCTAFGFLLGCTASAMAEDDAGQRELVTSLLYVISSLAVDTETNAARIEGLSIRIDQIEEALAARTAQ